MLGNFQCILATTKSARRNKGNKPIHSPRYKALPIMHNYLNNLNDIYRIRFDDPDNWFPILLGIRKTKNIF